MIRPANTYLKFAKVEDAKVWQEFKNDDKEAFEFIYQSNVRQLYNYGMKVTPDSHVVEDCVQELFIDLWDQRKKLANTDHIQFYLVKALRWKIIRTLEKQTRKHKNLVEAFAENGEMDLPYEDLLINEQIDRAKKEKLRKALDGLPDRQKEVIHLIFFKKYSYEQISQIMSMNLRSVYTLAWKALSNLRKAILISWLLTFF